MLGCVPKPFPNIEAKPANGIDVGCAPNSVVSKDAGLKENADSIAVARPLPELFEYAF
jgi:hypothetical protein